ncbi:MAG: hypothetical protein HRU75_02565 [Planctomycetia bacterium]|nr:MAG: hypothetical protein HRU75_02565 [Planctomycetia bacterium]
MPDAIRVLHVVGADRRTAEHVESWLAENGAESVRIDNVYTLIAHAFDPPASGPERPPALVLVNASRLSRTERGIAPIARRLWPDALCALYDAEPLDPALNSASERDSCEFVALDHLLSRPLTSLIQVHADHAPQQSPPGAEPGTDSAGPAAADQHGRPPAVRQHLPRPAPRTPPLGASSLSAQELARLMGEA